MANYYLGTAGGLDQNLMGGEVVGELLSFKAFGVLVGLSHRADDLVVADIIVWRR